MSSSGMLHSVDPVSTEVSEDPIASIIRETRIGELGTLAVTSNRSTQRRNTVTANEPSSPIHITLKMDAIRSSVVTRATRCDTAQDGILYERGCGVEACMCTASPQQRACIASVGIRCCCVSVSVVWGRCLPSA
jgi:hypothetical protein